MSHVVTRLTENDGETFRELLGVFGEAFGDTASYCENQPSNEYLRRWLGRSGNIAMVARSDGLVVGGLVGYVLEKFEQERTEVYIYDLAVAEAYRRRGIARGLIEHLRDVAREMGAWVIYVQADLGDEPAIRLYTSMGVREDVLHFDIEP